MEDKKKLISDFPLCACCRTICSHMQQTSLISLLQHQHPLNCPLSKRLSNDAELNCFWFRKFATIDFKFVSFSTKKQIIPLIHMNSERILKLPPAPDATEILILKNLSTAWMKQNNEIIKIPLCSQIRCLLKGQSYVSSRHLIKL